MSANIETDPPYRRPGAIETTTTFVEDGPHTRRRVSWGAIFGGIIVAVAVLLLLSTLGAGIGLGTVNTNGGTTPDVSSLGKGAAVWWVVTSMIALAFGGYVAARLAGIASRWDGVLHGLITWGIATLLTFYLLTSVFGSIVGGGFSLLGHVASAAGSGLKTAARPLVQAAGVTPDMLRQEAQTYLQPANPDLSTMSPQDAQKQVASNLATYAKGGPDAAAAKERVISIMAAQLHVSHDEAAKRFDSAQASLKQARDKAVQAAKNAADASAAAASKTSFAMFGDLLLDAIAAAIGGSLGAQRRLRVNSARDRLGAPVTPAGAARRPA